MTEPTWLDKFLAEDPPPCPEAIDWVKKQPSWEVAWANCTNPGWMLFRLGRNLVLCSPEHRKFIRVVVACARLTLPFSGSWQPRLEAICTQLVNWAKGEDINLHATRASTQATLYSTWAAIDSVEAALDSVEVAWYIARIAFESTRAAFGHNRVALARAMLAIIRQYYPTPPEL